MRTHARWMGLASLLAVIGGCAEQAAPDEEALPSWEEFLARSTVVADGRELYVVEWDLPIATREELRAYYDEMTGRGGSGGGDERIGSTSRPLLVNRVNGADDIWRGITPSHLRYCVGSEFAGLHGRVVAEMGRAASAWGRVANVGFVYAAAENASCTGTNTDVHIAVRPWNQRSARAFFPHEGRGTVWIDLPYFDANDPGGAPNVTTEGVLRHELGHVLGFRHEHNAEPTGLCAEDTDWRALTEYDAGSVMHYPWCNGVIASDLSLTQRDERGAVTIYGMATAPLVTALH